MSNSTCTKVVVQRFILLLIRVEHTPWRNAELWGRNSRYLMYLVG